MAAFLAEGGPGPTVFDKHIRDSADTICGGSFLLFGEWFTIPKAVREAEFLWDTDFTTGYVFPRKEDFGGTAVRKGAADVKVAWEFGRMHYLLPLAWAYRITRHPPYLEHYRHSIESFNEKNPLGVGLQWSTSMEVGIRIFNLMLSFELIKDIIPLGDCLFETIATLASHHGFHIAANLETAVRLQENNHYLANLLGLATVSATYPSHPLSKRWARLARHELIRSIRKQVLEDGSCFERSTGYTRLVAELLFFAAKALAGTEYAVPEQFWARLGKAGSFLSSVTDNQGASLQIGDNDSGRALCVSDMSYSDFRLVERLVHREVHKGSNVSFNFVEEALFYQEDAKPQGSPLEECAARLAERRQVEVFSDIGVALSRFGGAEVAFLAIDGFDNWSEAGHTHNDKLSFILSLNGLPIVVDPGTGTYTRDEQVRNALRGTAQHSTLWFPGCEQNEFKGVFGYERMGGATLRVDVDSTGVVFRGTTDCYVTRVGCQHTRSVRVAKNQFCLVVTDHLSWHEPNITAVRSFILHPNVVAETLSDLAVRLRVGTVDIIMESNAPFTFRDGMYSPRYGRVDATTIVDSIFTFGELNEVRIGPFARHFSS